MTAWSDLFERAPAASVPDVRGALAERRAGDRGADDGESDEGRHDGKRDGGSHDGEHDDELSTDPGTPPVARVVADADVLAADLLVGGDARAALDAVRAHSWVALLASDDLLADAAAVVAALSDDALAADWRERATDERVAVTHPSGDHPGLATAYRGDARHLLSFDGDLTDAGTGAALAPHVDVSVRPPDAFASLFDAASLHEAAVGGEYPGPDRDPRG